MTDCDPLWPDNWDQLDDDEQAFLDLHGPRQVNSRPVHTIDPGEYL